MALAKRMIIDCGSEVLRAPPKRASLGHLPGSCPAPPGIQGKLLCYHFHYEGSCHPQGLGAKSRICSCFTDGQTQDDPEVPGSI